MKLCIADNLKILRQKNGYTLEALAEIIDVSRQTVAKWEAEDSYPDISNCLKLATLFKVSLDELVNKPLFEATSSEFTAADDKICGVLDVSEEGTIRIPETIMQMFDIHPGEKVLLWLTGDRGLPL